MGALAAEMIKLRRSLAWVVVVILPVVLVTAAAATQLTRGEQPENGWQTVWVQSVVFAGLFPLAVGTAVFGSLVWRVEHRGSNGNALMAGPTSSLRVVASKAAVVASLTTATQLLLVAAVILVGKLAFGLPGGLPAEYLGVAGVMLVAAVPVSALQCALSMVMRSFAVPIAVALGGAGVSVVLVMIGTPLGLLSPYGVLARATQLGSGAFGDTGAISGTDIASLLAAAAALTAVIIAAAAASLDRRDVRI